MSACWGVMAEFATADELLAAAQRAREAGWRRIEAYSPFPIEGLAEAVGFERDRVAPITFVGGVVGGIAGFGLQWYSAVIDFPLNIAGRPFDSWPMFVPVTFEMAVLGGAFAAVLAMLLGSGLPQLRHPVFGAPDFDLATRNRFFLCVRADDPQYRGDAAKQLLAGMKPIRTVEVAP